MIDFKKRYIDYKGHKVYEMKDGTYTVTIESYIMNGFKSLEAVKRHIDFYERFR